MDKDTKMAIELITGLMTTAVVARTKIYSPDMMRNLFFGVFVGPDRDIPLDQRFKVLGVTMKEVNWAEVFEIIVVDNIRVTSIYNINGMSGTKEFFEVTIKINTDLTI